MNDEQVKVDAIVVGGGPAGLAAAYTMARRELEVILVERGEYAGSKNMGGLLYGNILEQMIPGFHEQAPVERPVARRSICFLGGEEHMALDFGAARWGNPPYNHTWTVHRAQFDRWFAGQVEEAGASLLEGLVVDGLVYEGDGASRRAAGIRIRGDEEFFSDVVILADGAHCLLSQAARRELAMAGGKAEQDFALGVKEMIGLPAGVIEDRFGLEDGQGAALDFLGVPFEGMIGGGFIYTQMETVCIGFVARLETFRQSGLQPNEVIDRFKQHPAVRKYLRGGELLEYSAHMIPEGGSRAVPQLAANGLMIAGDAAGLVNASLYKEGTNHAMDSGRRAGEVAAEARAKGSFDRDTLAAYERQMQEGTALADLRKYEQLPEILGGSPELLSLYPARLNRLLVDYFTMTGEPKAVIQKRALKEFMRGIPKLRFVRQLLKARRLM